MAAVFCASLSRRAMVWRSRVILTRSSRAASSAGIGARGIDGASATGGGRRSRGGGARRLGAEHVLLHDPAVAAGALELLRARGRGRPSPSSPRARPRRRAGSPAPARARRRPRPRPRPRRCRRACRGAAGDPAELAAGLDRRAVGGVDLGERAARRRGHLDRDLVGLELAEHLVLGDRVADLLEPGRDRRLADALAERRHHDLDRALVGGRGLGVDRRRLARGLLGRARRLRRLRGASAPASRPPSRRSSRAARRRRRSRPP